MPTSVQIENADPLTSIQARSLIAKARGSETYRRAPHLYPGIDERIAAEVGADSDASRHLSALCEALDVVGDGTVAISGGAKGVNYSKGRDREALILELLGALYDQSGDGRAVLVAASTNVSTQGGW